LTRRPSIFTVLRQRNPFLLWSGQLISTIGDNFEYIALLSLAYTLSGSTLAMSGVMISYMIPNIVMTIFSSVMADRWDRRLTMLLSDLLRGLIVLIPPILFLMGRLELWHLYLYSVFFGMITPFFNNANSALLPSLVKEEEYQALNSLMQTSIQLASVIGLALGGVVIAFWGITNAYFFDVFSFFFSALTIYFLKAPRFERIEAMVSSVGDFFSSWWKDFLEGIGFFKLEKALLWLLIIISVVNFAFGPLSILLLPFAQNQLQAGSEEFGWMLSSISLGSFVGAIFMGSIGTIRNRRLWILLAVSLIGTLTMILANTSIFMLCLPLTFLIGFALPMANVPIATIFQERTPDQLRGRVFGVRNILATGLTPISTALGGIFADLIGVPFTIFLCGLLAFLVVIPSLFVSPLMELNLKANTERRAQ